MYSRILNWLKSKNNVWFKDHFTIIEEQTTYSNCSDGELQLAGKVTATSGRLEICYNRAWGTVCNYGWGTTDSVVVCRQLGFQPYGIIW